MKILVTKSGYKIIQVLSGRSNVFLLSSGAKNILIDTSSEFMWSTLNKRLKQLNITVIDYLILTHSHFDHAANSNRIKSDYKASVIIHQNEAANLASGRNPATSGTNFVTRSLAGMLSRPWMTFLNYEPCAYDLVVDKRLDLSDFGFNAYILYTPGHTVGSMSIIVDDEIALVGDCMFGIFRSTVFPPYAEDPEEMISSWGRLLDTGCKLFLPSHGWANNRSLVQKDYNKRK
jgi:glyoxylase-like metal-dependent hydrolase (beta-lactamase superfamily II)